MNDFPSVKAPSFKCASCQRLLKARRCACGNDGLPYIDRRPVLLSRELREAVEGAMGEAICEAGTTSDSVRAKLLRVHVIPHFLHVLRDHETAARRQRAGVGEVRQLTGTMGKQLAEVSRVPIHRLRSAKGRNDG